MSVLNAYLVLFQMPNAILSCRLTGGGIYVIGSLKGAVPLPHSSFGPVEFLYEGGRHRTHTKKWRTDLPYEGGAVSLCHQLMIWRG